MSAIISNNRHPRVALLIESSRAYGRGLLLGVSKYVREHGPWAISLQEQSLSDATPEWLTKWKGDGIITRLENREMVRVIQRLRVPAIYLRNPPANFQAPTLLTDHSAAARMGFDHLRERGFRHFAFCGFDGADYSDIRKEKFIRVVEQNGMRCHLFENPLRRRRSKSTDIERDGLKDGDLVAQWIK
ncbi:MAG TPA: substrate-binding domain-containing protein, partial [Candidatus Baltobacteraceae bacterium]|nr:substrate-binding domain-containing protein [Candidatus Baltobacteraceae bacterium]